MAAERAVRGRFYIMPHAVDRFRERIGPRDRQGASLLTYAEAMEAIIRALDCDGLVTRPHHPERGVGVFQVWASAPPYRFRAVVDTRDTTADYPLPRVVTIRHYKAPPRERKTARRQRPDSYWQRRMWHARAVIWEYAGSRTPAWMAAEIERRTGRPISVKRVRDLMWTTGAAPTKHQGWLRPSQVAAALGVTQQQVTARIRAGKIPAHRNPGGRWWLISEETLQALLGERAGQQAAPSACIETIETVAALGQQLTAARQARAQRMRDTAIAQAIAEREQAARQERQRQRREAREAARQAWQAARERVDQARAALRQAEAARRAAWRHYHNGGWKEGVTG